MKKFLLSLLFSMLSVVCFAQDFTIPKMNLGVSKNDIVPNIVTGQVIYAQADPQNVLTSAMDIPKELANGVVIVSYKTAYYYQNKLRNITYQLVYSNIIPDSRFSDASADNPINVAPNERLGIGGDAVTVVIRIRDLDPHLVLCSQSLPLEVGSFWYYGLESLMPNVAKYLTFQPIITKQDKIMFPDGIEESFEHIIMARDSRAVSAFPSMPVKIKTIMKSYPVLKHEITHSAERMIHDRHLNGMNQEITVEFEGLPLHFYFPDNFAAYFTKEYTLGDPIWFYGNILYVMNNELHIYGRDFVLEDPDQSVNNKQNLIIQKNRQARTIQMQLKGEKEEDAFVDVTQTLPKGGYATYSRFFFKDQKTGKFTENKANIEEIFFDKDGNRVARMMWYDGTDMVRNTEILTYDENNRIIERRFYDSKMFQQDGKWKVDQKRSRIFNKYTSVYSDSKDGVEKVTTAVRYSYLPTTEHPDYTEYEKYNATGKLTYRETKYESDQTRVSISKYDEFGNIVYEKDNSEKEFEYKYEYVYSGNKVIKGKQTNLSDKSTSEWTCEYDDSGLLIKKIYPDYVYNYKYNKDKKIVEIICKDKQGNTKRHEIHRYDRKTGIEIFRIEDSDYGDFRSCRFWYTELSKSNWKDNLDPWRLAEELAE